MGPDISSENQNAQADIEQLERELARTLACGPSLMKILGLTAAGLLLCAGLLLRFLPLLRIFGNSMSPALKDGQIVLAEAREEYLPGEIIAFYYNGKILVKRVICRGGDWFDMAEDGSVYVNGEELSEDYVSGRAFGSCDLRLPYQVPPDSYFVMGDQRASSADSRMRAIGPVRQPQIIGRIKLSVFPLPIEKIGFPGIK